MPHFNDMADEAEARSFVAAVGTAELITTGRDGYPLATLLPILWRDDIVIAHMARANGHWQHISDDEPALLVITGAQAYISPSWYATKSEHGRVVPTWNYSSVHLTGRARLHTDERWLRTAVTELTSRHEGQRERPWSVSDAPESYIEGQLRAIVGIEIRVETVEAKAKLSQNRSEADRRGVIDGLRAEAARGSVEVAAAMAELE